MNRFVQKRILVTGCAGFLGSHLCETLLREGALVTGADNFLTGNPRHIELLKRYSTFSFIEADVIRTPAEYLKENAVFDHIFHFASPASPPRYQAHPVETYLVNSMGTHHLLQHLLETNPKGVFVFASTSETYGNPLEHPQKETYWGNVNPNGVRSCYDEAKRLGETICGVHARDFGMDVRIGRIFNTYGPRMDPEDGRVIPTLLRQALAGEPMTVYGDGTQTRSLCYVDDLIEGFLRLATNEHCAGETLNLGNPNEMTVKEIAEKIKQVTGSASDIMFRPLPQDDPERRCPDISKAKKLLGWEPRVGFEEGMKRLV